MVPGVHSQYSPGVGDDRLRVIFSDPAAKANFGGAQVPGVIRLSNYS